MSLFFLNKEGLRRAPKLQLIHSVGTNHIHDPYRKRNNIVALPKCKKDLGTRTKKAIMSLVLSIVSEPPPSDTEISSGTYYLVMRRRRTPARSCEGVSTQEVEENFIMTSREASRMVVDHGSKPEHRMFLYKIR
jgi:hypothetical protein